MQTDPPIPAASGSAIPRRRSPLARSALLVLIAFALGASIALGLAWRSGWLASGQAGTPRDATAAIDEPAATGIAHSAAPVGAEEAGVVSRVSDLERRINRLDLQAEAASGHAARAEGLLVAFAARRLLERGAPLGYLENQLQLRFGNAQPNAVRTIIDGSQRPVTLDSLRTGLENTSRLAVSQPQTQTALERIRSEVAGLFVLRHASAPSPQPELRLDRARALLDDGRVEAAAALVERLPNRAEVEPWLADAQRYVAVHDALDLIETAALLEPRQLIDGSGQPVRQPSPASPDAEMSAAATE